MITGGESHGEKLIGILDGLPAGIEIDTKYIVSALKRRQGGYGRGKRMSMEEDIPQIIGGIHKGKTTGAPVVVELKNSAGSPVSGERFLPRPGHADFVGYKKFGHQDMNIPMERASARESAIRTALGAICSLFLSYFGIEIFAFVNRIGKSYMQKSYTEIEEILEKRDNSPVYCPDETASKLMVKEIDKAIQNKETLGGSFVVVSKGVPAGLGSYTQWDRRIDAALSSAIVSIPSVKGVAIGDILKNSEEKGSKVQDMFAVEDGNIIRRTNHAGGIEGGITNGEDIVLTAFLKPIPTVLSIKKSVNIKTLEEEELNYIRSDTVVVPAASVVGEAMVAFIISDFLMQRYGGDCIKDMLRRVKG